MGAVTTCRSCHAAVVFVPSATTGRPMILDAKPAKGVIVCDFNVGPIGIRPDQAGPDADLRAQVVNVYTDHHATCPAAGEWKGRTRATRNEGSTT